MFWTTICCLVTLGGIYGIPVRENPVGLPTFLRDAVEKKPDSFRTGGNWFEEYVDEFGTRSLPLRSAIENVPKDSSSREPLRDAVERRPPPDEPFDPLLDLVDDIEVFETSNDDIIAPYRIGNPYQEIITFRRGRILENEEILQDESVVKCLKHNQLGPYKVWNKDDIKNIDIKRSNIVTKAFLYYANYYQINKQYTKDNTDIIKCLANDRLGKQTNETTTEFPATEKPETLTQQELNILLAVFSAYYPGSVNANTTLQELCEVIDKIHAGEIQSPEYLLVPAKRLLDLEKNPAEQTKAQVKASLGLAKALILLNMIHPNKIHDGLTEQELENLIQQTNIESKVKTTKRVTRNLRFIEANANLKDRPQLVDKSDPTRTLPRVVCFLQSNSAYRSPPYTFHAADVPHVCTHLVYTPVGLAPHHFDLAPSDPDLDVIHGGYIAATGLKRTNPGLKVMLQVTVARDQGGKRFSEMVQTADKRRSFIKSVISNLDRFNFDGIDINWIWPSSNDKQGYSLLLEELSEIFESRGWILSISVPASRFRVDDGFDVKHLTQTVDFINLQSYDLHLEKDPIADHHAPLLRRKVDDGLNVFYNVDYSVRFWLKRGLPRQKINLGVAFHARSFELRWSNSTSPGAGVKGPGPMGPYTQQPGMMAYFELCDRINTEGWIQEVDDIGSPFAHNGAFWAGYETPESIKKKVSYIQDLGLGGVSIWSIDMDDFQGVCGEKYPLTSAIKTSLYNWYEPVMSGAHHNICSEGDGLFSSPGNCIDYTICRAGQAYKVQCPAGEMYDGFAGKCGKINPEKCQPGKMVRLLLNTNEILRAVQKNSPKVVCYVTNWAFYRKGDAKFVPELVDTRLCTHIVYAFSSLDPEKLILQESDPWADIDNNLFARITSVSDVPVLLALGGWTDSNGEKYSRLVSDGSARRKFVTSTVSYLRKYNFRGLHIDWNYPVCWQSNCQKGPASDKANFAKLIQELSTEFNKQEPPLILAAAISGYKEVLDVAYDIPTLGKELDFISVMTYDYHGHWEQKTGHVSPLYYKNGDTYPQYNSNYTMELLVSKGAPRSKLLLGLPFYGQSFTLAGKGNAGLGAIANGPGEPGEFTKQPGMLAYYEICHRVKNQQWKMNRDPEKTSGPFAFSSNQWVGYDDVVSIREKGRYVVSNNFGGVTAWTIDLDDFTNRCCGGQYPLLHAVNRALGRIRDSTSVSGDCTKPPAPVTPPAPVLTTAVDSGAQVTTASTQSTTWWKPETSSKPTTMSWWTPSTTTTSTTTTSKPSTTTISWWKPSSTSSTTTTSTTSNRPPQSSTMTWWPTTTSSSTTASWWEPTTDNSVEGQSCEPGTYKPDVKNCNSYFRCILSEWKRQTCATGLHWNSKKNLCDWPSESKCSTVKRPETTTSTMKPSSTTTPSPVTSPASGSCSNGQYSPHEECHMFYICVNGQKVPQTCGPGLQWSASQSSCDWESAVKCGTKKIGNLNQRHQVKEYLKLGKQNDCESGDYAPIAGDCSQYMMCLWGQYETFSCASGLHWNNEKHICDWPKNSKCDTSLPPSQKPIKPVLKPTEKPSTTTLRPSTTTKQPEPLSGYYKIVCYFTNWAWYRRGLGKYTPEHIDANLCTHIVYGFAVLDYERLVIKAHDSWADFDNKFYERVVAYKAKGLKVTLAIGGWNDSAGDKYSRLVNNPSARARFIKHVIEFLEKYGFEGLDLDWEYPKCWQVDCKKGPDSDKTAFAAFIRELSAAFKPKGLLLSAAVSPSKTVIDAGYDVPALAKYLDWVAVMTYDFHGQWDKKTGHVAPLYLHPEDDVVFFNANFSINYWISEGVPRRNIVMGMPLYGQSFNLETASNNGLNAKAPGPGQAGEFTRAAGFLAYYEICDRVLNRGWTVVQDPEHRMGPYAYKGSQWVSFDDVDMIKRKAKYIRDMNLGGGMVWALDLDDFRDRCNQGVHPLMNALRTELQAPSTDKPLVTTTKPHKSTKPSSTTTKPIITTSLKPQTTTISSTVNSRYKMVCYFTNWAWYRQGGGKYLPGDIDPDLCTHIVYGFAVLNGDQLIIKPHDTWADFDNKFYEKVTAFKAKGIKVLIAIGGWNDSAGDKYSRLVNNPSARRKFIAHVCDFIEKNNFDGLDLDWEYPKCWQVDCTKGPSSDKEAFAEFVKELHTAFKPKGWLLSAAVSPAKKVVDAGYDVPTLSKYLDWIAVMCYDYHGQWDKQTGHVAPMYAHPEDSDVTFNTNFTINYWIAKGAEPKKLVLGMPLYGQSFSLADNSVHGLNSPTYGGGEAGEATRARGFLSYYEICQNIQRKNWNVVRDRKGRMGPYAYLRDQWVSFDDIAMLRHKSEYIKAMGLGGGMVWALDLDDFKDICGCERYPLLKAINRVLRDYPGPQPDCPLDSKTRITPPPSKTPSPETPNLPCGGKHFSSDDADCKKYFLCIHGSLMSQSCPNGLFWNKDHCDWPENTKCHPDGAYQPEETPPVVETTVRPVTGTISDSKYKVVCYFTNWAWYRQGDGKYKPEDIDTNLCTHITYGFAVLDSNTLTIKPHDSWADIDNDFYGKVTALKQKGIKVLIAIGGWNDSLGDKYSRLVNNPSARQKFIENVVQFIKKWNFDGLDLDWEYPKCWQVDCEKGPDSDKQGFASLVQELSAVFKPNNLLLSSAVSPSKTVIDAGYDVPILARYFDWIAVMTYDFHGHWDKQTGHVAPLYYYPNDTYDYFNANFSLHYWLEKGAPASKLIMGIPLYGQSFSLADTTNRGLNAKSYGPGEAGEFTRAGGFLAFYEICERVKRRSWTVTRDPEGRIGPYASHGNQWVSYDDVSEVKRKTRLIKELNLGGGMIWALDLDDFRNRCGCGHHPLLRVLNQELRQGDFQARSTDCT